MDPVSGDGDEPGREDWHAGSRVRRGRGARRRRRALRAAAPGSGDALDRGQAALVGSNAIGGDAVGVDVAAQTTDGQVRGSPVLDLFLSQRTVSSGTESQVMVDILNTGEMDMATTSTTA